VFLHEAGGGLLYGFVLGWLTFGMLSTIDQYHVEVLIMLAMVMGGYALANHLHVSGPLAMVVAGLVLGNDGRARAMSNTTRYHVDLFWELIDQILNAVLFALIGLELLIIKFAPGVFLAAAGAVLVTLLARVLTVGLPTGVFRRPSGLPEGSWKVLTWGALRGGISVALVLSLPDSRDREVLLALTYCVVVFSILVQGLTIGRVVRHAVGSSTRDDLPSGVP
jgi:CPA1 family monovalent cation:H+ antiporter